MVKTVLFSISVRLTTTNIKVILIFGHLNLYNNCDIINCSTRRYSFLHIKQSVLNTWGYTFGYNSQLYRQIFIDVVNDRN